MSSEFQKKGDGDGEMGKFEVLGLKGMKNLFAWLEAAPHKGASRRTHGRAARGWQP